METGTKLDGELTFNRGVQNLTRRFGTELINKNPDYSRDVCYLYLFTGKRSRQTTWLCFCKQTAVLSSISLKFSHTSEPLKTFTTIWTWPQLLYPRRAFWNSSPDKTEENWTLCLRRPLVVWRKNCSSVGRMKFSVDVDDNAVYPR